MGCSKPSFCSLSALLNRTHCERPKVPCSYMVNKGTSPCSRQITQKKCQSASPYFPIVLDLLTGLPNEKYTLSEAVDELANLFLCPGHLQHAEQAGVQWLEELTDNRRADRLLQRLQELYDTETEDRSEEKESEEQEFEEEESEEDDENDQFDDDNISEEDCDVEHLIEGISGISFQSSSPFTSFHKDTSEDQATKRVYKLANKRLEQPSRNAGYIYLITTTTFPGMVKIGYSKLHPQQTRFPSHKRCYQSIERIFMKPSLYPFLVERFVLAELSPKHCKLTEECHKCKTRHREWLEIDHQELIKIVEKWIAFVDTDPYDRHGMLRKTAVLPPPFDRDGSLGGVAQSTPSRGPRYASPLSKIPAVTTKCVNPNEDESDKESDEPGGDRTVSSFTKKLQAHISKPVSKAESKARR